MDYTIYTDGAASNNGKENAIGGWGYVVLWGDNEHHSSGRKESATNNQMELTAVIESLKWIDAIIDEDANKNNIIVHTDSAYIVNCFAAQWYVNWRRNGWKNAKKEPVANKELWEELLVFYDKYPNLRFVKVKGHANDEWNNFVDNLAVEARTKEKEEIKILDVIIPAYNCSSTLDRALSSVVAQTKKEKCIVTVVDDGSTEDLKPIVESYKDKILVRYKKLPKNLGWPGLVRQWGIDNTTAPFIMFLDSDDMLAPTAIEQANNLMMKSTSDMILGFFYNQTPDKLDLMTEKDTTWLHGNVYRRSFLEKYNIRFAEGYNEDGGFNTQCYLMSNKIGLNKNPMYYWMNEKGSLTRSQEGFGARYGYNLVSTLNEAYRNIFALQGNTYKALRNMGGHVALFYKIYNEIMQRDDLVEEKEKFIDAIQTFQKEFRISSSDLNRFVPFSKGFLRDVLKYINPSCTVRVDDFLKLMGIEYSYSINDFSIMNTPDPKNMLFRVEDGPDKPLDGETEKVVTEEVVLGDNNRN